MGNSGWGRWRGDRLPKWRGRDEVVVAVVDDELGGVVPSRIGLSIGWQGGGVVAVAV